MVYVFLADGFEEVEALTAVDCLRRSGVETAMIGVTGEVVTGAHGISVQADLVIQDLVLSEALEMIVLPGGMPGTRNLEAHPAVQQAIEYCSANCIYIAAICAAPSILGKKALLAGKQAVCYPGFEESLIQCEVLETPVCVCDRVITARSAGCAMQFALTLVELLCGRERRTRLESALVLA